MWSGFENPNERLYFCWDEPMTVAEFREELNGAVGAERCRLLGRLLREAKDTDVWAFTTLEEVVVLWPGLLRHLGRRRAFWTYLLSGWGVLPLSANLQSPSENVA